MAKLSELLSGSITKITANDLKGCTKLKAACFANSLNLTSVELPDTVKSIGALAFYKCPITSLTLPASLEIVGTLSPLGDILYGPISASATLTEIDASRLKPDCFIYKDAFNDTGWLSSFGTTDYILIGENDSILFRQASNSDEIPMSVKTIVRNAISLNSTFTEITIPDTVESIQGYIGGSSLTKVTVGSSVRKMYMGTMDSTAITTWVFRQPAEMTVELPKPGDGFGLGYNKSSRSITIYTDNECIKNYNWSGDNITATIYPLADAPT